MEHSIGHMSAKAIFALTVAAVAVTAGALNLPQPQKGKGSADDLDKAPAFTAVGADGKSYTLAALTKKGPVFLFFIKKDCPVTAGAMGFYKSLYNAYGGKASIVGILNGDAAEYKAYNSEHKLPFLTVLDPAHKIVEAYRVEHSPWLVAVRADGTVGATWKGYSQPFLQEMNKAAAKAAGKEVAKVDFSRAPKDTRYG
jgi:peroxiredoxin